jgi:hypothetical protein
MSAIFTTQYSIYILCSFNFSLAQSSATIPFNTCTVRKNLPAYNYKGLQRTEISSHFSQTISSCKGQSQEKA